MALFLRGLKVAPDMPAMVTGVTKCRKAVLSKVLALRIIPPPAKVGSDDVFFFPGSKNFLDFLRREGQGAVATFCLPVVSKARGFQGFATRVKLQKAVVEPEGRKVVKVARDRMAGDKKYLRHLGDILGPNTADFEGVMVLMEQINRL